jgi:maltooligosyltrehalose trehalohydrolase
MNLMDLSLLGARQQPKKHIVDFGVYLPWITQDNGYSVVVKIKTEVDQFFQEIDALSFPLTQGSIHPVYGAYWSGTADIGLTPAPKNSKSWGSAGTYLYRYEVSYKSSDASACKTIDWVIDPFAREYGIGKMSAFSLDYVDYKWSNDEATWRVPGLRDLAVYELHLKEFNDGIQGAIGRLDYLADLGINCLEIMPVSNVIETVEWGFQPIGYFGIDDRFGNRSDMQQLVDKAHARGIAVILDVVFGHTGNQFPYAYLYDSLGFSDNPFCGALFGEDFGFGRRTSFGKPLVDDFFFTVCHHLLDCFHIDGFRYDCVPEYWDPVQMRGFHCLAYSTYQETKAMISSGQWIRFSGNAGEITLIQCAEQLECPVQAVADTYSSATWQDWTFNSAVYVASCANSSGANKSVILGEAIRGLGLNLGLYPFPRSETMNGDVRLKTAFQYIENHDHPRFVNNFGILGNGLFSSGDRMLWFRVQPYLIALLLADGVPMLWQGQELCENNSLPGGNADGRVNLFRPVAWEYFYDDPGRGTLWLVKTLLALRKNQSQFRGGEYYFFDDWDNQLSNGVLVYRRRSAAVDSFVAVNFGESPQSIGICFERGGDYVEDLFNNSSDMLADVQPGEVRQVNIPENCGRVWTRDI